MNHSLDVENDDLSIAIPPGWPQNLMALAGFMLVVGPTLTVLLSR